MNPYCRKCQGAMLGAIAGALILHCPVNQEKQPCPYLPPDQHTHSERYVPPQYRAMTVTVATTAGSVVHDALIDVIDDMERPGFKRYVIKLED